MRHEATEEQAKWFTMEARSKLRRLSKLGIIAHQPGVAAYCKTNEEERQVITESLLIQKVGSNPKSMKLYHELKARESEAKRNQQESQLDQVESQQLQTPKILVRFAKIAFGATVRWKRKRTQEDIKNRGSRRGRGRRKTRKDNLYH